MDLDDSTSLCLSFNENAFNENDDFDNDEDKLLNCTPPEVVDAADEITRFSLLPHKSRVRYERQFMAFQKWRKNFKTSSSSERTVLAFLGSMVKDKKKPTTIWAYYSMLKCMLKVIEDIDISKYKKVTSFLKRNGEGYQATKALTFTEQQINKFLAEAPNDTWLAVKVVLIFGICGACRTEEYTNISRSDVRQFDDFIQVNINNTKTKISQSFSITQEYVDIVCHYMDLRPATSISTQFFLRYHNGACSNQVIGKNTFSKMPYEIALFLNLDDAAWYTGHAFCIGQRCSTVSETENAPKKDSDVDLQLENESGQHFLGEEHVLTQISTVLTTNSNGEVKKKCASSSALRANSSLSSNSNVSKSNRTFNFHSCPSVTIHYYQK